MLLRHRAFHPRIRPLDQDQAFPANFTPGQICAPSLATGNTSLIWPWPVSTQLQRRAEATLKPDPKPVGYQLLGPCVACVAKAVSSWGCLAPPQGFPPWEWGGGDKLCHSWETVHGVCLSVPLPVQALRECVWVLLI